jgi:hypothetical protein
VKVPELPSAGLQGAQRVLGPPWSGARYDPGVSLPCAAHVASRHWVVQNACSPVDRPGGTDPGVHPVAWS